MQYGIDRHRPLFDGQAVVYGLADIPAATQLYQRWQAESHTMKALPIAVDPAPVNAAVVHTGTITENCQTPERH